MDIDQIETFCTESMNARKKWGTVQGNTDVEYWSEAEHIALEKNHSTRPPIRMPESSVSKSEGCGKALWPCVMQNSGVDCVSEACFSSHSRACTRHETAFHWHRTHGTVCAVGGQIRWCSPTQVFTAQQPGARPWQLIGSGQNVTVKTP